MLFLEITGFDCGGEAILSAIKFIMLLLDVVFVLVQIILIVFISIKIYKNSRKKTSQNKEINLVDTERASQQYISEYDKNGKNNKKIKYKERPMKEEGND